WLVSCPDATTSHPSNSSSSVVPRGRSTHTFVPASSNSSTSASSARTGSVTTGSGSYSTATSSAASTLRPLLSASTTATISPANLTLSRARNGRPHESSSCVNGG